MERTATVLCAVAAVAMGLAAAGRGVAAAAPGVGEALAAVPQARTLDDGVYTEEQAKRGAEVYRRACVECHQTDEYKGFLRRWTGLPVSFFYEIVRSTMPQNNPGGLSRDEYADVLTYIFSINGVPTGEEELAADAETLDAITITVPPEDGSS